jgi:hypothetical protein
VPVVVALADGDERDPRADESKELAEALIRRAVMRDLQELHLRRAQRDGHRRFRISREERVELPVAREQNDAVLVRVLARPARSVGPQNADAQLAELEELADAGRHDSHASAASLAFQHGLVGAVRRLERVQDEADRQRIDDVGGPAHVVSVWVGDNERREAADSERAKLSCNTRLGRALVDQDSPSSRLQQDSVSLADVEHHDPQALRRRRGVVRTQAPAD